MTAPKQSVSITLEVPARLLGQDVTLVVEWSPWGAIAGTGEFHLADIRSAAGESLFEAARAMHAAGDTTEDGQ